MPCSQLRSMCFVLSISTLLTLYLILVLFIMINLSYQLLLIPWVCHNNNHSQTNNKGILSGTRYSLPTNNDHHFHNILLWSIVPPQNHISREYTAQIDNRFTRYLKTCHIVKIKMKIPYFYKTSHIFFKIKMNIIF